MLKRLFTLLLIIPLVSGLHAQNLKGMLGKAEKALGKTSGLSTEEAGKGLKEALNVGVSKAVDFLSVEDGYYKSAYKVLLPEEAQKVTKKLKAVPGFADAEEKMVLKINRAAEDAAKKAKPIFVHAIKNMSFRDAMDILMGNQDAATRYLEKTTYQRLFDEFLPVIQTSLDKFNARDYWRKAVKAHNKVPLTKKANPELDDYVTKQALLGMFALVQKKEEDIRTNQASRTSDLLKKVFAKQDNSDKRDN